MWRANVPLLYLQEWNESRATCEFSVCIFLTLCVLVCCHLCVGFYVFNYSMPSCSDDVPTYVTQILCTAWKEGKPVRAVRGPKGGRGKKDTLAPNINNSPHQTIVRHGFKVSFRWRLLWQTQHHQVISTPLVYGRAMMMAMMMVMVMIADLCKCAPRVFPNGHKFRFRWLAKFSDSRHHFSICSNPCGHAYFQMDLLIWSWTSDIPFWTCTMRFVNFTSGWVMLIRIL